MMNWLKKLMLFKLSEYYIKVEEIVKKQPKHDKYTTIKEFAKLSKEV